MPQCAQVRVRQDGEDVRYQVLARGDDADEARDAAVLRDYFNLDTGLAALSDDWAARDGRYAAIRDYIAGVSAGRLSSGMTPCSKTTSAACLATQQVFIWEWVHETCAAQKPCRMCTHDRCEP